MIKYILRRSFNFLEEIIMKENGGKVKSKQTRQLFVRKYCLVDEENSSKKLNKKSLMDKYLNMFMPFRYLYQIKYFA